MNTLYDAASVKAIIDRIEGLSPTASGRWGKMKVSQMLAHCAEAIDMARGTKIMPRVFIGRIIGPLLKTKVLNEEPIKPNMPTHKEMTITDDRNFTSEQQRLINNIKLFHQSGRTGIAKHIHPFFGMMTTEEWGRSAWKHLDHHLKQFGG